MDFPLYIILSHDLYSSSLLASVSDDCTVAVKVLSEDNSMMVCRDHRDFVRGASWDDSDHTLLSCGWDGQFIKHSLTQLGEGVGVAKCTYNYIHFKTF